MPGRNPSAGFVLVDALVAFAIAALALTLILSALPNTALRQADRLNRHLAMEFAFSALEEYRVTYPQMHPKGEDASGWSWSISETDLPPDPVQSVAPINLVEVEVVVWHKDRPDIRATLKATIARRDE
jgi:type II secretory pathway pseudopilin PulG